MRDLIVTEFVSLDGVMQAPGGEPGYAHTGWVGDRFSDELYAYKTAEQLAVETLVLGRTTYESFAESWPDREGPMAEKLNTMEKFVVSSSMGEAEWANTTVLRSLDEVGALKEKDGGPIMVAGSRTLARGLLAAGLVDQLNLQVFPVVLGSGDRLYREGPDQLPLTLVATEHTPNGVALQSYRVSA